VGGAGGGGAVGGAKEEELGGDYRLYLKKIIYCQGKHITVLSLTYCYIYGILVFRL
jgi:hypothetical protein